MHAFPSEFSDLLNARGRRLLARPPRLEEFRTRARTPIAVFDDLIDEKTSRNCIAALDKVMFPLLRRMHNPIPREALTGQKKNYKDRLPKTVRVRTTTLNSSRSQSLDAAREIGLAQMMESESFRKFAEAVIGARLQENDWGRQVICYEAGDYSGPHNDHHPESDPARYGFVDVHVMFSNEKVTSQYLVYEEKHFLSKAHDVSGRSGIAVYKLPFWHYTTPLIGKPGARRWLLLGSLDFDPPLKKLSY